MASQITSITIVYSAVYSGADQRKHESTASLAFVRGIHRWSVNSRTMASNVKNVSIWWRRWRHHDKLPADRHSIRKKLWLDGLSNRIKFKHHYYGLWNRLTGTTWFGQWSWICVRNAYVKASSRVYADTGISPFGRNCHHWLHWNLSQYSEFEWLF